MFSRFAVRTLVPVLRRSVHYSSKNGKKMSFLKGGAVAFGMTACLMHFTAESAAVDMAEVRKDIEAAVDACDAKRDDGTSIAPTLIRLAWHAAGTFCCKSNNGGSNGATMRFAPEADWGANAGLAETRSLLEPIKQKYPGLSYADLWTFAGTVAVESMGGPKVQWKGGRTDSEVPTTVPDGRLPDADKGKMDLNIAHVREVFYRMGFNDREIVALLGAHSVGRCHTNASGYWGPWTYSETTFSNEFYRLLLTEQWRVKKTHEGKPWTGPKQFETSDGKLMMLPSDVALVQDPAFRVIVEDFAKNEDVFFAEFASAFGKLMELGVSFKDTACPMSAPKGLFGLGFWGL